MKNKRKGKKRLTRSLARRSKSIKQDRLSKAWRNIFVKAGILQNTEEV